MNEIPGGSEWVKSVKLGPKEYTDENAKLVLSENFLRDFGNLLDLRTCKIIKLTSSALDFCLKGGWGFVSKDLHGF